MTSTDVADSTKIKTMKVMKTYNITISCDPYNARFHGFAPHHTTKVIYNGLSLREAQARLLDEWNNLADEQGEPYAANWGMAVCHSTNFSFTAYATRPDGTRSFRYDVLTYEICEEVEEEEWEGFSNND